MPILDHNLIPQDIYEKILPYGFRGVFLGGCIERKEGSSIRPSAHCHCNIHKKGIYESEFKTNDGMYKDRFFGWICLKSRKPEKLICNKKATNLFKHELAHLMSAKKGGYGKAFCKALVELNGRMQKYEHKTVKDNIGKVRNELRRKT